MEGVRACLSWITRKDRDWRWVRPGGDVLQIRDVDGIRVSVAFSPARGDGGEELPIHAYPHAGAGVTALDEAGNRSTRENRPPIRPEYDWVTVQSLTATEIARALIDLLPSGRGAALDDLRCSGDAYASVAMTLGDLAATGRKIPVELAKQIKRLWPNEDTDLDELLHSRLAQVTPGEHPGS